MVADAVPRLTKRQQLVLGAIIEHIETLGCAPTVREVGDAVAIKSTNGVTDHLKAIERKGYLERGQDGKTRALKVLRGLQGEPYLTKDEQIEQLRREVAELRAELEVLRGAGEATSPSA